MPGCRLQARSRDCDPECAWRAAGRGLGGLHPEPLGGRLGSSLAAAGSAAVPRGGGGPALQLLQVRDNSIVSCTHMSQESNTGAPPNAGFAEGAGSLLLRGLRRFRAVGRRRAGPRAPLCPQQLRLCSERPALRPGKSGVTGPTGGSVTVPSPAHPAGGQLKERPKTKVSILLIPRHARGNAVTESEESATRLGNKGTPVCGRREEDAQG